MPYSIQVFCRRNQYEPSVTFYASQDTIMEGPAVLAGTIATGLQYLMSNTAECSRWEAFNATGIKVNEGPLTGYVGTWGSDVSDPKEFLLVRKNVAGEAENPSVMYVPFPSLTAVQDGELIPAAVNAFALATAAWLGTTMWNSDGLPIESYTFRHKTRRKKVRRLL